MTSGQGFCKSSVLLLKCNRVTDNVSAGVEIKTNFYLEIKTSKTNFYLAL